MKNLINLIILFNIFIFISYAQQNNNYLKNPRKVIVTGKILHFNNNNSLKVDINRLSFEAKEIMPDVDGLGNFSFTFNSYIPSDITIHYGSYFYMVTHPGDSLHFVFDGQNKDLLKSIKFSGDASKSNQDLAAFQEMYFANSLYTNESIQLNALKNYGEIKYLSFCDSMKTAKNNLYKKYLAKYSPDDEIKNWITTFLENDYYYSIAWYPEMHSEINQLNPNQFKASQGYYNKLNEMLPIKSSMLISTCAINGFLNYYYFIYVLNTTKKNYGKTTDSLLVASINKLVPAGLIRQMILTYMLEVDLNVMRIDYFKENKEKISDYVQEPYLKQPLFYLYKEINDGLENPQFAKAAVINNSKGLSEKEIMDSILSKNKGEVIYVDFWATWCGPCMAEMPNSKELMKELKGKKVAFVYMCLNSKLNDWKAMLSKLKLEGQQYFLDENQSKGFRKAFQIPGIPDYLLINKKGNIVEKGNNLRPNDAKEKIKLLLQ